MAETYGLISIIPALVVIITALLSKRVFEPMLLGAVTGFIILNQAGFVGGFVDATYVVLADPTTGWVILVTSLFGAFVALAERAGGALGFGDLAARYVKTGKSSLIATWILGIIVFIDDYLNALAVGSAMRNVTDKYNIPREMLAYTVNTTAAPVCVLNPFSTWAVFMIGLIELQGITKNGTAIGAYIASIPFMIYAIIALLMVPLVIMGVIPKIGKMKKAFVRAQNGQVFPEGSEAGKDALDEAAAARLEQIQPKVMNFLIPIIVLVVVAIVSGNDLVKGVMAGIATCGVMYLSTKTMTFGEFMDTFFQGIKDMVFLIVMILTTFVFMQANDGLGFTQYVIDSVKPLMNGNMLPAISFATLAILAFTTGSFWGLAAISMPIIIPLAQHFDVNIYLALGAIISGSIFGSHACFYSDAMLLSSTSAQIKPMDQAIAVLPYAILGGAASFIVFMILGFIV